MQAQANQMASGEGPCQSSHADDARRIVKSDLEYSGSASINYEKLTTQNFQTSPCAQIVQSHMHVAQGRRL